MEAKTETRTRVSEWFAIASMGLLFLFIADTSLRFLPLNEIERGRTEGLSLTALFIASFVVARGRKSRLTTILLIAGGSSLLVFIALATMLQVMVLYWALPLLFMLVNVLPGFLLTGLGIFRLLRGQ